jgi:uncharacterized protein
MPNFVEAINAMATMTDGWRYVSLIDSPEAQAPVTKKLPSARIVSTRPDESKTGVVIRIRPT